ncbi:MAG: hypothetical protein HYR86_10720 [Candidatus Rokubacteria bacterium]|nr:hypothetical protein [Candidatus Rokubacteria bacterium]
MTRLLFSAIMLLLAGCASWVPGSRPSTLLREADRSSLEGRYADALAAYDEFLEHYPEDRATLHARTSRAAAAAVLATRAEAERLGREVASLREALAARERDAARGESEVTRLRAELAARQADFARLNGELERLREDIEELKRVDLRQRKRP